MSSFEKDLEFIQLLTNPKYIKWLYSQNFFNQDNFTKYLKRLLYFEDKRFFKYLHYPQSVEILKMLINNNTKLDNEEFYKELERQQFFLWKNR